MTKDLTGYILVLLSVCIKCSCCVNPFLNEDEVLDDNVQDALEVKKNVREIAADVSDLALPLKLMPNKNSCIQLEIEKMPSSLPTKRPVKKLKYLGLRRSNKDESREKTFEAVKRRLEKMLHMMSLPDNSEEFEIIYGGSKERKIKDLGKMCEMLNETCDSSDFEDLLNLKKCDALELYAKYSYLLHTPEKTDDNEEKNQDSECDERAEALAQSPPSDESSEPGRRISFSSIEAVVISEELKKGVEELITSVKKMLGQQSRS